MEADFKVNENSVQDFVKRYVIIDGRDIDPRDVFNPYNILGREEIIIRDIFVDDYELDVDGLAQFTLSDRARESGKHLVNTYTYRLDQNDSISFKLVLVEFKVELK